MVHLQHIHLPLGSKMEGLISLTAGKGKIDIRFSPILVKFMLGGKWPEFHGFNFDAVHSYCLEKDGTLVPYDTDFGGEPVPGPSFALHLIDDVFSAA